MSGVAGFEELLAEGAAAPVEGWDFAWLHGRATEERPSWGYSRILARRMSGARAALDIQTGGGEVLAAMALLPSRPPVLVATESWPPNVEIARRALTPLGVTVVAVEDSADLPFPPDSFDLVSSRHPTLTRWDEVARVLEPGGTFLSQQVGAGSARELTEALMGPQEPNESRSPQRIAAAAVATGLEVVDLRHEALRMTFDDVGAIVYFLRKVVWTVPGFAVDRYRRQLFALHERIAAEGPFVAHSQRFLIEARKPPPTHTVRRARPARPT
jgi:SAM-dependent methyltransferase